MITLKLPRDEVSDIVPEAVNILYGALYIGLHYETEAILVTRYQFWFWFWFWFWHGGIILSMC